MRYFKGVPEDFLRDAFVYDPTSPSGLVRTHRYTQEKVRYSHVIKMKGYNSFRPQIRINGKNHVKSFPFGRNGKSEFVARLEAEAWIATIKNENPETPLPTGYKDREGYWRGCVTHNGKHTVFCINRLIFFLCTDIDIEGKEVDHIDNNPSNNKIENLRSTTPSQNQWNTRLSKANTTGVKGLFDRAEAHTFTAGFKAKGKLHKRTFSYGPNATDAHKEEVKAIAIKWLNEARNCVHGEYANHGDKGSIAS